VSILRMSQLIGFILLRVFLEKDKLALVFMKIIAEDYNVPIIAVERVEDFFCS